MPAILGEMPGRVNNTVAWNEKRRSWLGKPTKQQPKLPDQEKEPTPKPHTIQIVLPDKTMFRLDEVAEICAVHVNTVRSWIQNREIKAVVLPGNHLRIPKTELSVFLRRTPTPRPGAIPHHDGGAS